MRSFPTVLAVVLLSACTSQARDGNAPERSTVFQAICAEFALAVQQAKKEVREAKDTEARAAAQKAQDKVPALFAERMVDFAKAKSDDDAARDAAAWVLKNQGAGESFAQAAELLRVHHAGRAGMWPIIVSLRFSKVKEARPLLGEIVDRNADRRSRAYALRTLAELTETAAEEYLAPEREVPERWEKCASLYKRLNDEFADEVFTSNPPFTYGDRAKAQLAMLKGYIPGCTVADFQGIDTEGRDIRLREPGKVVLLLFWGKRVGAPSLDMLTLVKETEAKYRGRPLAVLGVNTDPDRKVAAGIVRDREIPFRSFWNGPTGGLGPITKEWGVERYPTAFLIDPKGVIRHRLLGVPDCPEELKPYHEFVERLVKDAEGR